MRTFIREFTMQPGDELRLAVRPAHRDYVAQLFASGQIVMSGPLADETGAVIVYRTADEAAARDLIEQDPYCPAGVVNERSLREWNVVVPSAE